MRAAPNPCCFGRLVWIRAAQQPFQGGFFASALRWRSVIPSSASVGKTSSADVFVGRPCFAPFSMRNEPSCRSARSRTRPHPACFLCAVSAMSATARSDVSSEISRREFRSAAASSRLRSVKEFLLQLRQTGMSGETERHSFSGLTRGLRSGRNKNPRPAFRQIEGGRPSWMVATFRHPERKRPVRHPIRHLCCTRCRHALGSFIAGKL
jgi:hypothetical protein